jgi:hypothetical protein
MYASSLCSRVTEFSILTDFYSVTLDMFMVQQHVRTTDYKIIVKYSRSIVNSIFVV